MMREIEREHKLSLFFPMYTQDLLIYDRLPAMKKEVTLEGIVVYVFLVCLGAR